PSSCSFKASLNRAHGFLTTHPIWQEPFASSAQPPSDDSSTSPFEHGFEGGLSPDAQDSSDKFTCAKQWLTKRSKEVPIELPSKRRANADRSGHRECGQQEGSSRELRSDSSNVNEATPIDSIGIFVYQPFDSSFRIAPYEVCAGDAPNDCQVECPLPPSPEPSHGGEASIVQCHGARHSHVTIRQTGPTRINGNMRRMFISEVVVFKASSKAVEKSHGTNAVVQRGEVAMEISARFDRGRPTDVVGDGGVLLHVFDGYEEEQRPWTICHSFCRHGPVDSLSSSLISRKVAEDGAP
ncbi:MAG: hypothetical protein SGPRY_004148, partial [Prymnesium sp.]